jgi:DNA-binding Lrp family transcriptional regulator
MEGRRLSQTPIWQSVTRLEGSSTIRGGGERGNHRPVAIKTDEFTTNVALKGENRRPNHLSSRDGRRDSHSDRAQKVNQVSEEYETTPECVPSEWLEG